MRLHLFIYMGMAALVVAVATACASRQQSDAEPAKMERRMIGGVNHIPRAIVYRTTKDYADRVPVTMDEARTRIMAYPAPSDLRSANGFATPVAVADGFLLDRRGVTATTAFLDYTYSEYSALSTSPRVTELMSRLLDKYPIAEMYVLPITTAEALADTARCNEYIRNGFKGCRVVVMSKTR